MKQIAYALGLSIISFSMVAEKKVTYNRTLQVMNTQEANIEDCERKRLKFMLGIYKKTGKIPTVHYIRGLNLYPAYEHVTTYLHHAMIFAEEDNALEIATERMNEMQTIHKEFTLPIQKEICSNGFKPSTGQEAIHSKGSHLTIIAHQRRQNINFKKAIRKIKKQRWNAFIKKAKKRERSFNCLLEIATMKYAKLNQAEQKNITLLSK